MRKLILAALSASAMISAPALAATITVTGNFSGSFNNSPFNQAATFVGTSAGNSGQQGFNTYLLDSFTIDSGDTYTFDQTATPFYYYSGQGIEGFANGVTSNVFRFNTATGAFVATDNTTFSVTNSSGTSFTGTNGVTFTGGSGISSAITASVPEPATWAMMIAGFGLVGGTMRRRSTKIAFA